VSGWRRHLVYTKHCIKTTWKLRIGAFAVVIIAVASTRGFWSVWVARSLVCEGDLAPSDVMLIENFDPYFVLFERAAALQTKGLAGRILVPVQASRDLNTANLVSQGVAEVMAKYARVRTWESVPIPEIEPISLNAAVQLRRYLAGEHVKSVIVVAPAFRSRRSALVYRAMLNHGGVDVRCDPVFGPSTPEGWTETWHGIQEVGLEFLKLQYYRWYVLPFLSRSS
jgi:hypothetical protein